jgi:hypothetical protein
MPIRGDIVERLLWVVSVTDAGFAGAARWRCRHNPLPKTTLSPRSTLLSRVSSVPLQLNGIAMGWTGGVLQIRSPLVANTASAVLRRRGRE